MARKPQHLKHAWQSFRRRSWRRKLFDLLLVAFAAAGAAIIGAWVLYQTGITNNRGAVDKNYRYLMSVSEIDGLKDTRLTQEQIDEQWALQYGRLAALARYYPENARLIMQAAQASGDPLVVDRMVAAAALYMDRQDDADALADAIVDRLRSVPQQQRGNLIPWMAGPEWPALKDAILRDSALIVEAGRLTGVEPRLIVGCLIGEQIRLFNSKREMFKQYLGPVKVLSVQSQFSYGVNGIKDFTAAAVEEHLRDPQSEFYMGPEYEHLLDFSTDDHATERYNRLVDYRNHLYSYLYTGCILHQTMLQWRRAGFDISDRPDILFTLFNVGFGQSRPKADPVCGGSHITVGDSVYTFGAIGFDFYYSGELAQAFPFLRHRFARDGHAVTADELRLLQEGVSDCKRPEYGSEYRRDSSAARLAPATPPVPPDPYGLDHDSITPTEHTAQ